jgi:hypothetical protein
MRLTLFRWRLPLARPTDRVPPRSLPGIPGRRRAAAALAVGLVAILGTQLGFGWAINTERSPLRDPIYFDKLALLRQHRAFFPAAPDVPADRPVTMLFVGSSRTLNAMNARAAGDQLTAALGRAVETFNFGQAGAGPVTNAVYVRRLMRDGVRPDFVLIEIHPVFLAGQRPDPPETRWLLPFRLRPDELPVVRAMGFPAATPAVHGPRGLLAPWYEYRFLILDRFAPFMLMHNNRLNGGHESDGYGFARQRDTVTPAERAALLRIAFGQYRDYFAGFRPTGPGVAALRDTLDQCRAAGWRAGLVLMPESTDWRGWYPADGLRELDGVVAGLAAEYGVPVFDVRRWVPDDLSGDGHHLTGLGADLLTGRLTRDALAPWFRRALAGASQDRPGK